MNSEENKTNSHVLRQIVSCIPTPNGTLQVDSQGNAEETPLMIDDGDNGSLISAYHLSQENLQIQSIETTDNNHSNIHAED